MQVSLMVGNFYSADLIKGISKKREKRRKVYNFKERAKGRKETVSNIEGHDNSDDNDENDKDRNINSDNYGGAMCTGSSRGCWFRAYTFIINKASSMGRVWEATS